MDPLEPSSLNGRTRYDPLPPSSHLLHRDFYPHHHHHHPPPPIFPPPPQHHHHHHHEQHRQQHQEHHYHRPDDEPLYLPYPHQPDPSLFHPPLPAPRVSDRIVYPEGHPDSFDAFAQDIWDSSSTNCNRIRVFDERMDSTQLDWEKDMRHGVGLVSSYRGASYPPSVDVGASLMGMGRKRSRWDKDCVLEEDSGGRNQRLGFWDGRNHRLHDPHFELLPPDASLATTSSSPRGGSWDGFVPSRGGEGFMPSKGEEGFVPSRGGEASSVFGRWPPPPNLGSSGHSHSEFDLLEKDVALVSDAVGMGSNRGPQENRYNKGKKRLFGGENARDSARAPMKRTPQKTSALGRIQSGTSVWKRIEGQQFPLSPPLPPPGFLDQQQPKPDMPVQLDVSFKSNALVAKAILAAPSRDVPNSDGKGSATETPKKKVRPNSHVLFKSNAAKAILASPSCDVPNSDGKSSATETPKKKVMPNSDILFKSNASVSKAMLAAPSWDVPNSDGNGSATETPKKKVRPNSDVLFKSNAAKAILASPSRDVPNSDGKSSATETSKKKVMPNSDVSFKSNALVAKATLAASSRDVPNSDGKAFAMETPKKKVRLTSDVPFKSNATKAVLASPSRDVLNSDGKSSAMETPKKKVMPNSDVSFKSNALVAKAMSPSHDVPNSDGKGSATEPKKKVRPNSDLSFKSNAAKAILASPSCELPNSAGKSSTTETPKKKVMPNSDVFKSNAFVAKAKLAAPSRDEPNSDRKGSSTETPKKVWLNSDVWFKSNAAKAIFSSPSCDVPNSAGKSSTTETQKKKVMPNSDVFKSNAFVAKAKLAAPSRDVPNSDGKGSATETPKKKVWPNSDVSFKSNAAKTSLASPSCDVPNSDGKSSTTETSKKKVMLNSDVSKSNAFVAKAMLDAPSRDVPNSDGKGSATETPKKKVVKKKVKKKRIWRKKKIITPVVLDLSSTGGRDGVPKEPVSSSPHKNFKQFEVKGKAIVSDIQLADDANSQPCPQRVVPRASIEKSAIERYAKSNVSVEGGIVEYPREEDRMKYMEANGKDRANAIVVDTESSDDTSSQICQQAVTMKTRTLVQESDAEEYNNSSISVEGGIREENHMTHGEEDGRSNANPLVSDIKLAYDASLQSVMVKISSPENGATEGSAKATKDLREDHMTHVEDDARSSGCSDLAFIAPLKEPSSSIFGVCEQVVTSVGFVTPCHSGDSLEGDNIGRKQERQEQRRQPEVGMEIEVLGELARGSDKDDAIGQSHMQDRRVLLPLEVHDRDVDQNLSSGAMNNTDDGISLPLRNGSPQSNCLTLTENISMNFSLSKIGSLIILPTDPDLMTASKQSFWHTSDSRGFSNDDSSSNNPDEDPNKKDDSLVSEPVVDLKSDKNMLHDQFVSEKTLLLPSNESRKPITAELRVANNEEPTNMKTSISSGIRIGYSRQISLAGSLEETTRSSRNVRHRTWHRNDNPSASSSAGHLQLPGASSLRRQPPKKLGKLQNSYIRKGNSLIRKSSTAFPLPQPSNGPGTMNRTSRQITKSSLGFENKVDSTDHVTCSSLDGPNPFSERPKTPPIPLSTRLPNCTQSCPHPMLVGPLPEAGVEAQARSPESQNVDHLSGSVDYNSLSSIRKSKSSDTKKMIYVKRKSNQLVAAPGPEIRDLPIHSMENAQMLPSFMPSDLYFRKKKNQLIRNASSSDSQYKQEVTVPVSSSNLDDQMSSKICSLKCSTTGLWKKRLDKVRRKTYKRSKFSHVWTLSGAQTCKGDVTLSKHQKVLPYLLPWKRAICWKSSMSNTAMPNKRSLSLISRKLQLTKERNTIYTVSPGGFSLRKSGVLSIGGSSLKWSKSIERRSKKASEEATLAVAEVEKKERERKRTKLIGAIEKNQKCLSRKSAFGIQLQQGERIFRVGSTRYKMDSSKRILLRIPDEQSSYATVQQSRDNSRKSFVPRRLLIGNDEYVRIGNGNQLVRDPKKLIRILASEKVRRSLHTARLRLARKQQYCQFFTRFGKCNKDGGKCPYIHDPTKVAICTKFLRGSCSNTDCKLTHEVIPERMPDCSYFLQGLCTNTNCPYRHVNVNPNASVCDGFLRGYCADGDECRKKHSYVCPIFEASGLCPQGSTCKLHHPKGKSKKRKRATKVQSNSSGRYFCSSIIEASESLTVASDKIAVEKGRDPFCCEGRFADYINLDVGSDDEAVCLNDQLNSQPTQSDSDLSDTQPDDLDALIKPVRIMNRTNVTNAST